MWGWGSGKLVLSSLWFNKLPRWFCCKLKVEKHCLNQKETQGHSRIGEIHINYWRQGWLHCMAVEAPNLLLRPWDVPSMPPCSVERKGGRRRSCGQNMSWSGRNGDNLRKTHWVIRRKGKNDRVLKVYIETSLVVQWPMLPMQGLGFNPWSEN